MSLLHILDGSRKAKRFLYHAPVNFFLFCKPIIFVSFFAIHK